MAARLHRIEIDEAWRKRIQTTVLVERLQKHAIGEVEMSNTQVRAAECLLRKTVPDLAAVQHSGDANKPIAHTFSWAPSK